MNDMQPINWVGLAVVVVPIAVFVARLVRYPLSEALRRHTPSGDPTGHSVECPDACFLSAGSREIRGVHEWDRSFAIVIPGGNRPPHLCRPGTRWNGERSVKAR